MTSFERHEGRYSAMRVARAVADRGFCVIPGFVGPRSLQAMMSRADALVDVGGLAPAAVGAAEDRRVIGEVRGDLTRWLEPGTSDTAERRWLRLMERMRAALNRVTYAGAFEWEGHWALYPPGAGYQRHVDELRASGGRLFSTVLYLNPDWSPGDGGELRVELSDGERLVPPVAGTLVLFRSNDVWHEVLPTARPRRSVTGWFRTRRAPSV